MTRDIALAVLALLPFCAASDLPQTKTEVREFAPGGSLRIELRAGDVRIVKGTDAQHIHLRYTPRSKDWDAAQRVRLRFDVHSSEAEIEFKAPQGVDIDIEVEVPSLASLQVRMSVGDLSVEGIEGNKDLRTYVGDIKVDLGPKPNYWKVDASTHIGDIGGHSLGEAKGWLGKSLKFHGDGQYRLHAHAGIGDIRFYSK